VDNRVEAPSRASGEDSGSGGTTPADSSDGAPTPEPSSSAADSAITPDGTGSAASSPSSSPSSSNSAGSPANPRNDSGWQVSSGYSPPSPVAPPRGPADTQPAPAFYPAASPSGNIGSAQTSAMAAVAGAATSARGLASKVGASFSGLSKPKPKPRPKASPVRRPAGVAGRIPMQQPHATRPPQSDQQTRRAMLSLERIEPMSVMKFSFLISLVAWVIVFVAVAVIYFALSKIGVFSEIEKTWGLVTYNKDHPGSNLTAWFGASRVLEYTALVCTINAILFTALATIGAALYNLVTNLTGGIEVTLKESD
jgi:hypothetical protein